MHPDGDVLDQAARVAHDAAFDAVRQATRAYRLAVADLSAAMSERPLDRARYERALQRWREARETWSTCFALYTRNRRR